MFIKIRFVNINRRNSRTVAGIRDGIGRAGSGGCAAETDEASVRRYEPLLRGRRSMTRSEEDRKSNLEVGEPQPFDFYAADSRSVLLKRKSTKARLAAER